MDGAPGLGDARAYAEWSETFWDEYERLCDDVDAGTATFLDPYAATEPAEFFAVVTEAFFMQPRELLANHPALYAQLQKYYRRRSRVLGEARKRLATSHCDCQSGSGYLAQHLPCLQLMCARRHRKEDRAAQKQQGHMTGWKCADRP